MENNTEIKSQSSHNKDRKIKAALATSTIVAGLGGGIGIGYAIWHSQNNPPEPTTTDVVSFDSAYKPSVSTADGERTYHASSTMDGKISYKADNLPAGKATFDNSSGKLNYTSAVPTNQDITITATSDKGGHSSIKITLLADASTPITDKTLNIEGMRDLAVPYKDTYEYQCNGATLTTEGLPSELFRFENNTLTYTASTTPENLFGSFKLKATANDGSGKTKTITISYYGVSSINENKCRFLYTDGRVSTDQDLAISDGSLTLTPSTNNRKLLKAVYFGTLNGVTTIGSSFLSSCNSLTSVDLSPFTSLTSIGDNFLSDCTTLKFIDLSSLTSLQTIGNNFLYSCYNSTPINLSSLTSLQTIGNSFLYQCYALTSIDFSGLTALTNIGDSFLQGCSALKFIDLSGLTALNTIGNSFLSSCNSLTSITLPSSLTTIGDYFLSYCYALTSIDLSSLANFTKIGNYFLSQCRSLTSIDLSPLVNLESIGDYAFYVCISLTSVDLSPLTNLTTIGSYFLSNCSPLTSIDLSGLTSLTTIGRGFLSDVFSLTSVIIGSIKFSNGSTTTIFDSGAMNAVTNLTTNKIYGSSNEVISNFKLAITLSGSTVSSWAAVVNS